MSSLSSDIASLSGRPYGGLAVLMNRVMFTITNIGANLDNRVQALCLPQDVAFCSLTCTVHVCHPVMTVSLSVISGFILHCIELYSSSDCHIIICGDFNASWNIIESENRLKLLKEIVVSFDLFPVSELYTDASSCPAHNVFSWLDNIFVPISLLGIVQYNVVDDVENDSDYLGFSCTVTSDDNLNLHNFNLSQNDILHKRVYIWFDANKLGYFYSCGLLLQNPNMLASYVVTKHPVLILIIDVKSMLCMII